MDLTPNPGNICFLCGMQDWHEVAPTIRFAVRKVILEVNFSFHWHTMKD
jgi:hypothetical protein